MERDAYESDSVVLIKRNARRNAHGTWYGLYRCGCGTEFEARTTNVNTGRTRSCGCLQRTRSAETLRKLRLRHGRTGTRLHRIWVAMRRRCDYPAGHNYAYYGGRGITVCARWRDSFESFAGDMGEPPTEHHSIDRIDPDGNYEPGNCRWATRSEQMRNTRRSND